MNAPTPVSPQKSPAVPWWRVPHMWLVVGGPALVVVAGIVTAIIATNGADPVLNKEDFERDLKAATSHLDGKAKTDALIGMQPAGQARNHAASPVVPKAP
jgi:uncharacterized protein